MLNLIIHSTFLMALLGGPTRTVKSVGKFFSDKTHSCTATLIDKDLILTAAHCIIIQDTGRLFSEISEWSFYPNFKGDLTSEHSSIIGGSWETNYVDKKDDNNDWAVLSLSKPLGEKYGWFPIQNFDFRKVIGKDSFVQMSYNTLLNGDSLTVESGCRILDADNFGITKHNCLVGPGSSGGPLFYEKSDGSLNLVAINVFKEKASRNAFAMSASSAYPGFLREHKKRHPDEPDPQPKNAEEEREASKLNGPVTNLVPYLKAIYKMRDERNWHWFCSGVPIGPNRILTAAHCMAAHPCDHITVFNSLLDVQFKCENVIEIDKQSDLALLAVSGKGLVLGADHFPHWLDLFKNVSETEPPGEVIYAMYGRIPFPSHHKDAKYLEGDPLSEIVALFSTNRTNQKLFSGDMGEIRAIYDSIQSDGLGGETGNFIKKCSLKKWEKWLSNEGYGEGQNKMILSCQSKPGDSGGGVFDGTGHLIGIQTSIVETVSLFRTSRRRSGIYVTPIPSNFHSQTLHGVR